MFQSKLHHHVERSNPAQLKTYRKPAIKIDQNFTSQKPTFGIVSKSNFKDFFKNSKKSNDFEILMENENVLNLYSLVAREDLGMKNHIPNQDEAFHRSKNLHPTAFYAGLWIYVCKLEAEERLGRGNSWSRDLFEAELENHDFQRDINDSTSEVLTDYNSDQSLFENQENNDAGNMPGSVSLKNKSSSIPLTKADFCTDDESSSIFDLNSVASKGGQDFYHLSEGKDLIIITDEEETSGFNFLESGEKCSSTRKSIRSISDRKRKTSKTALKKVTRNIVESFDTSPKIDCQKFDGDFSPLKNPIFDSVSCGVSVNTYTLQKDLDYDIAIADELGFSDPFLISDTDAIKNGKSSLELSVNRPNTIVIHSSSEDDDIEEVFSEDLRKNSLNDSEISSSSGDDIINLNKIRDNGGSLDKFGIYLNQFEPREKKKRQKTSPTSKPKKTKKNSGSKWGKKFYSRKKN